MQGISTTWLARLKRAIADVIDFQSRVWVVRISQSRLKDESFVINEDSFAEPLQWMKSRQYSPLMLEQVENMQRSQVRTFNVDGQTHRLMRVK